MWTDEQYIHKDTYPVCVINMLSVLSEWEQLNWERNLYGAVKIIQ